MIQHYEALFTDHALFEMERRGLGLEEVYNAYHDADQCWQVDGMRWLYQKKVSAVAGQKAYLIRVIADKRDASVMIVTAYRTSKIEKYWEGS